MADVLNPVLKTQDIVGRPVISLQGEEIGTILRIIVDPDNRIVAGLTVNIKGLFKGEKGMEFDAVKSFGDYAVIVENSKAILPLDNLPAIEKLGKEHNMYNMRVVTPEGKLIGTIDDFYFNTKTGQIEKYILSGGLIKNLFKGKACLPSASIAKIGKDLLVTFDGVEETLQTEDAGLEESIENIKGDFEHFKDDFEHWKDDFEKTWDKTKSKVLELSKSVGENLIEVARVGKGKSREVLSKTGEILNEKKGHLRSSYDWWVDRLQAAKNGPEKPLPDHDVNMLIGLKAGRAIIDSNGQIIVNEDDEITGDIIQSCQNAGKTRELLISIATRDLEEKMKSIENDV